MKNILMKTGISSGTRWILCSLLIVLLAISLSACKSENAGTAETTDDTVTAAGSSEETAAGISSVTVSFRYRHMSTHASNQIAVWVEDESGKVVRTIMATDFTAARKGYLNREDALSHWVSAASPADMTDEEIDAISSATPNAGDLEYVWDMTDDKGNRVPEGRYTIKIEGTLYWSSNALYTAEIDTENTAEGELEYEEIRSEPDNTENADMITDLRITAYR